MRYIIYKITNNLNGKIYIGKHQTEKLDDDYFGSGTYLNRAIKKYGIENFTFHLEFELQTEYEMNLLEKFVVNMEFLKRNDVYNLRQGGDSGSLSFKTRKKISDSLKGHIPWNKGKREIYTEESLKKMSLSRKGKMVGEKNPFWGKKHSEQTKQKMRKPKSEIHKQHIREAKSKNSVLQYTLDLKFVAEYKSSREAERQTGIAHNSINMCCKGKQKSSGGFRWFFSEDLVYFF